MPGHALNRMKEGIRRSSEMLADFMRRSQERKDAFIAVLLLLLKEETKHKIIKSNKWRSTAEECSDEELLKQHLGGLIMDFDCNLHRLEENEITALAEVINKNPNVSFFFDDD